MAANFREDQLARWAQAPSETEEGKCQATVARITKVIQAHFGSDVSIFLQGSYKNRTNVRMESDVDIVVRHDGFYFPEVHFLSDNDKQAYWTGFTASEYTFFDFKADIHRILEQEFGVKVAERKDKCILVLKNDYRVNADVIPCFVHKRMQTPYSVGVEGIELRTDKQERVYSFPEHHYLNGVSKNKATETMYKAVVRILKNVRNNLVDKGVISDKDMASFFLECLVWNLPDNVLLKGSYLEALESAITKIWNDMRNSAGNEYAEVSDLKWLFKNHPQRTPKQAEDFMLEAWQYIGF